MIWRSQRSTGAAKVKWPGSSADKQGVTRRTQLIAQKGFSLIELMVVVAILAVLAAILIPNYFHARAEAQAASCEVNERQIATALELYAVDNSNNYPNAGTVNAAMFGGPSNIYLVATPTDPAGGPSGAVYTFIKGNAAPCGAGAIYHIVDGGMHDPLTVNKIPGNSGSGKIVWCSEAGLRSL